MHTTTVLALDWYCAYGLHYRIISVQICNCTQVSENFTAAKAGKVPNVV